MPSVEVDVGYIDVDVDLEDFDTEDLVEELQRRREHFVLTEYVNHLLSGIYEKRRNNQDYQWELDQLIDQTIGRVC